MTTFKVGDRVAVYGHESFSDGEYAYVSNLDGNYLILTTNDGYHFKKEAHVKQCRRLVKKERRRVWINPRILTNNIGFHNGNVVLNTENQNDGWIEFIEVSSRKR